MNSWLGIGEKSEKNQTEEVGMAIGESQLVYYTVDEADSCLVVQIDSNRLEELYTFLLSLLSFQVHARTFVNLLGNEKYDCVYYRGSWDNFTMDAFLA